CFTGGTRPNDTSPELWAGQTVTQPNSWGVSWVMNGDGTYAYPVHPDPASLPEGMNALSRTVYKTPH
ncbi:MAG: hypothetical protein HY925_11355, partial [Elusimicrobia bacterium]|nr:hypothetical protein [Elusimicrobiota bacterium]